MLNVGFSRQDTILIDSPFFRFLFPEHALAHVGEHIHVGNVADHRYQRALHADETSDEDERAERVVVPRAQMIDCQIDNQRYSR